MTGEPTTARAMVGWGTVTAGVVLVLVGVVLLAGPGPGWVVLWLGVLAMVLGLVLARAR